MIRALARFLLIVGVVLGHVAVARAATAPAERLSAVKERVADAERAALAADEEAQRAGAIDDPRVFEVRRIYYAELNAGLDEALNIARADPGSETGFEALEWLLRMESQFGNPDRVAAVELATKHHAGNVKLGEAMARVAYYAPMEHCPGHEQAMALFDAVLKQNPDRTVRGHAAMGLAHQAKRSFTAREESGHADEERFAQEAIGRFEAVVRDYGDCEYLQRRVGQQPGPKRTLREIAERELFELKHLRIGSPAPDIEGKDLEEKPLKLSDYRGKVVVVCFWASWCGPCMAQVPNERALVERLKDRPFVFLGVNGDGGKAAANAAVAKHGIPWRSFWNGPDGAVGPIARAWNVRSWPTVYVIDSRGVIRGKHFTPDEKLIDGLLAELQRAANHQR